MTHMPDRDWLERKTERENAESNERNYMRGLRQAKRRERWHRIRSWFFTPRGALVYFGAGYALVAIAFIWWRS